MTTNYNYARKKELGTDSGRTPEDEQRTDVYGHGPEKAQAANRHEPLHETEQTANSPGQIHDIYDRICKRCISLSSRTTIMLINELYGKDYPLDSAVDYHWTEHSDNSLHRTLADSIITIDITQKAIISNFKCTRTPPLL